MRERFRRPSPALVISVIALFAALGGGYAIGAKKAKIKTKDIANQAVTNKKIKKNTIKGNRVDETSLSGTGIAQTIAEDTAAQVNAGSGLTTVLTLQVPAGSYVLMSKAVLAKGGAVSPVQCRLSAEGSSDRSLAFVDATSNETVGNQVAHTFASDGTATLACDNPSPVNLFVTDKRITAIPVGAIATQTP
jgi:hypothetical protein